ncbi:Chromosome partition protein Smc [Symmachiella dynata]|uniref:c-type cytochrome domain-containing protein n=1 Tax=Symmachiella dynata TaxID=2527995 RepID=UPI00118A9E5A|nr:c-type cytochrome domain-containing protein [Symmachiella dynata]QDT48564.1 Chromosome partition protein Smc [Symmachiella dynata]
MRKQFCRSTLIACGFVFLSSSLVFAEDEKPEKGQTIKPAEVKLDRPVDFDEDILPILEEKCIACHNLADAENDLSLEDVPSILKGGKAGPAVVAKDPDKSLLYNVIARTGKPAMPPLPNSIGAEVFTPEELGLLRLWITEGAQAGGGGTMEEIQWRPLPSGLNPIYSVTLSADGQFAACGRANRIVVYHLPSQQQIAELTDPALLDIQFDGKPMYQPGASHRDFVRSLAFNDDGTLLASGGYRTVKLWQRPRDVVKLNIETAAPDAVAVSPDGKWLATGAADKSVKLFNLADGSPGAVLNGAGDRITSVLFSADSSKVIASSLDKTIRLWNVADAAAAGQITSPAAVNDIALNKDGTQIISADADNMIRVWPVPADASAAVTAAAKEIKGHEKPVTAVALITPAGEKLLSGSDDGTVRVWNLADGKQLQSMAHAAPVTEVAVRSDGGRFVSTGGNSAKLWNPADAKLVAELKGEYRSARVVAQRTADESIAKSLLAGAKKEIEAREKTVTKTAEAQTKAKTAQEEAAKKIPDAQAAAKKAADAKAANDKKVADAQAAVKAAEEAKKTAEDKAAADKAIADATAALKAAQAEQKKTDKAAKDTAAAAKKVVDTDAAAKKAFASAERASQRAVKKLEEAKAAHADLDVAHKAAEKTLAEATAAGAALVKGVRGAVFSADNKTLITVSDNNTVQTWNAESGTALESFHGHQGPVTAVALTATGDILSASADNTIKVWDRNPSWKIVGRLGASADEPLNVSQSPFADRILALDFSSDGSKLATGGGEPSRSGELMIWDVAKQTPLKTFVDAHSDTVFGVEFSRDGRYLLSGAADKFAKIFDVESGKPFKSFEGHTHHVLGVAWRADGLIFASAGADNAIKVWDVTSGEQKRTIGGYSKQVTSLHFIGLGSNIVSSGGDKTVRYHKTDNGQNFRSFSGGTDYMYSADATADETVVVAGGEDGVLRIWNGADGKVIINFDPPKPPADNSQAKK